MTCTGMHVQLITNVCHINIFSDINECGSADSCDVNSNCTNTDGSYTCSCLPGYSGDGITCSGGLTVGKSPYFNNYVLQPSVISTVT